MPSVIKEREQRALAEGIEVTLTHDWQTTDSVAVTRDGEIIWRGQKVKRNRVHFRLKSLDEQKNKA